MKRLLPLLFILYTATALCQDSTVAWIHSVDTTAFEIQYSRKQIPRQFYNIIGIEKLKDIANPGEIYDGGCVRHGNPRIRLNWIAKDKNEHWVMSVSYGGWGHHTNFYFVDKEKGSININEFAGRLVGWEASFGEMIRKFELLELQEFEYDDEQ